MNNIAIYQNQNSVALFDDSKVELLKQTICKGASPQEFELFLHACKRTGLDPFMRQIYSVQRWDSQLRRNSMTIQTGIDGYRLIAERTGKYAPGREPTYQYDAEGRIISSTAYIKKQTHDGTWHEIAATAFFSEYCQKTKEGKPTQFWLRMAHTMLAKCAEALALRKAFPADLSGIYTKEEMQQSSSQDLNTPLEEDASDLIQENNKIEKMKVKTESLKIIEEDQWTELCDLINKCDTPSQDKIWQFLHSNKVFAYDDIDEKLYKKIKKRCLEICSKDNIHELNIS